VSEGFKIPKWAVPAARWLWSKGIRGLRIGKIDVIRVEREHQPVAGCPCCDRAAYAAGKALEYRRLLAETYAILNHPPEQRIREIEEEHRRRIMRALGDTTTPGPPS
jgi:hypothetical protein